MIIATSQWRSLEPGSACTARCLVRAGWVSTTVVTAALVASAIPAEAVGAFHAAVRVSTNCYGVHLAQTASSTQRGFAMCGTGNYQIAYVEGTGTKTWRSVPTKLTGYVVAVADDGSTTYLLYTPNDRTLSLATRTHGGTLHHSVIHRSVAHNSFRGGIVAKSGKWWADWVDYNGGTTDVWQAQGCTSPFSTPRRPS